MSVPFFWRDEPMQKFCIQPGNLSQEILRLAFAGPIEIQLESQCWDDVNRSHQAVLNLLDSGESIYGLNTGFGLLAHQRIPAADLAQLQLNLVRSHCAGVGELLDDSVVRLVMLLKLASLARGYSGVRPAVIESLIGCFNAGVLPCIPSQGSVGASGDLAPLAHMSLALLGEGTVRLEGVVMPAAEALDRMGIPPLVLGPKEGLALINGTQVSTSLALAGLFDCQKIFSAAVVAGAMSIDAAKGSDTPFDERIHEIRNHLAQKDCARAYRELLMDSEIRQSHRDCSRVQDPYSLRCQPQVMGACLDSIRHAEGVLVNEANAVSDNPLVFSEGEAILSGGNFHAQPVAMVADMLANAIAEIGSLSERRIALLIDQHLSELPSFLTNDGGLNSGFMIPQVTAAALTSENKHLASSVSVDSLPTSANQEDHVSMATYAARRLGPMNENAAKIIAIELLAACQGIEFRLPLKTSPKLTSVYQQLREAVPFYDQDRPFHDDISWVSQNMVDDRRLGDLVEQELWYRT
ncbi:histidine ammonia-lyase [bacterium]|nr:histidine ammonia-lyase [Mariniblastus sp.]MDB4368506.1 histidine ammonia-lyase [bacterium]MDB4460563.1 histidine ammonia-lyase [bacterium]MDC0294196.1 histidine ammonia-lyase [Mariniblastus sp.]